MSKILIVEDDEKLSKELKIFLEKEEINILNQIDKTKFNF